jgi:Icc protein
MRIINIEDNPFYQIAYRCSGPRGRVRQRRLLFQRVFVDQLAEGVSAIAVTSDLQGRESGERNRLLGEVVSEELRLLCDLGEIPSVDGVVMAGDLYDYPECHKLGGTGDVTSVWNAFAADFKEVVGVHGNHDMIDEVQLISRVTVLDGNVCSQMGLVIGGVSGIIGRADRNQRKSEPEFSAALKKVLKKNPDVIVLHQGPDDPKTGRAGETLVRELLEKSGSGLVICGHCHWEDPYADIGENQVLNVDGRVMLLVEEVR